MISNNARAPAANKPFVPPPTRTPNGNNALCSMQLNFDMERYHADFWQRRGPQLRGGMLFAVDMPDPWLVSPHSAASALVPPQERRLVLETFLSAHAWKFDVASLCTSALNTADFNWHGSEPANHPGSFIADASDICLRALALELQHLRTEDVELREQDSNLHGRAHVGPDTFCMLLRLLSGRDYTRLMRRYTEVERIFRVAGDQLDTIEIFKETTDELRDAMRVLEFEVRAESKRVKEELNIVEHRILDLQRWDMLFRDGLNDASTPKAPPSLPMRFPNVMRHAESDLVVKTEGEYNNLFATYTSYSQILTVRLRPGMIRQLGLLRELGRDIKSRLETEILPDSDEG